MKVNPAAFGTMFAVGSATAASAVAAAAVTSTVATVAFATLAVVLAGISIASLTAYIALYNDSHANAETYFKTVKEHSAIAVAVLFQYTIQVLVQAVVQGFAMAIENRIVKKFA